LAMVVATLLALLLGELVRRLLFSHADADDDFPMAHSSTSVIDQAATAVPEGVETAQTEGAGTAQGTKRSKGIAKEELIARLDRVPVFTLVDGGGVPVPMIPPGDMVARGHFYVSFDDAEAAFEAAYEAHVLGDGDGELALVTVGLGQALGAAAGGARLVPRAPDLTIARTLPCKETVDWDNGGMLPLFACHGLLQERNGRHVKPLFLEHADAEAALRDARAAAGGAMGAELELVTVTLQRMARLMMEGLVDADKMCFVPSSKALRSLKELQRQARAEAGKAKERADEPPPLE